MMDDILVAGYTVQDVLLAVGILTGFVILLSLLKKVFRKEKVNPYMQFAACEGCGWHGQVSRHAGLCPGCNLPLGNRRVGRPLQKEDPTPGQGSE